MLSLQSLVYIFKTKPHNNTEENNLEQPTNLIVLIYDARFSGFQVHLDLQ